MADISKFDDVSELQAYEDYIASNITEWEAESIARVCRKIGKIGRTSEKELEKFNADKEAKKEWERIVAALAIATALNIRTLKKAYISEFEAWEKQNEYLYQYRGKKPLGVKNGALQGIIDRYVKQNGKDIINLTNTKALSVLDRNGNPIRFQDAIYKSFLDAVKTVTEGEADFYTTMRQTVQNLGGGGCRVNYGEGITRRLDTVVRQNMAYGIKQSHKEYNEIVGREIGADGIEIDYHSNSRPSHRYMQGKQYAKGSEGKTINGVFYPSAEKEGVYDRLYDDYNCRHYETDIILGVSEPRYSAEELRRFEERDKRLYKIGNIEKDGYGWSQSMRAIETDIRKSKDEINALSALGGNEAKIRELKNRIKTFQGKYYEISDVTGIAKEKRRLTVQKPQNLLTNSVNGGIIKENIKKPITPIMDNAINKVPNVSIDGFSDEQNTFIQNQHKDLLKYARDNNGNKEVAFVFRKDLADRAVFIGSDDVINFGNGLDGKGDNLFVMHNHPRNSSFSKTDIDEFINNNNIKTLSIVKNNGEVEIITKSEKYSQRETYLYKERYKRKIAPNKTDAEYDKMVQKFLSYCERENIIRWIK